MKIFLVLNAHQNFPELLERSSAAREVAEAVDIKHRIMLSRVTVFMMMAFKRKNPHSAYRWWGSG